MHSKQSTTRISLVLLPAALLLAASPALRAETCTTQSAMPDATYNALAAASLTLATKVQANDDAAIRTSTISEFASNFSGIAATIAAAAPNLKGATPQLDQVFLLDASANKRNPDGSAPDAQFYCSLNHSQAEADFTIAALPPGRYAFASVKFDSTASAPWLVSLLLRQESASSPWLLAGLYPKSLVAAGHDGLWYWKQARELAANKQPWNAYVFYEEARNLLQPAEFVSSSHLENLRTEALGAAPPALSNGIGNDIPLVIKDATGAEFDFTALTPDNSLHKDKLELAAYLKPDQLPGTTNGNPVNMALVRQHNLAAMAALLHAHPEFRQAFAGVWVFAQAPGLSPIPTEAAMDEIH